MINTRDSFAAKGSVSSILLYDLGMASCFVNRPKYINLLSTMPIVNPSSRHYKPKCVELYRSVSQDRQYFCSISSEYYRSPLWTTDSNQIVKKFGRNQNRGPRAHCRPISDQKTSSLNIVSVTAVLSELPRLMDLQFREAFFFFFFLTVAVYEKQFPNFNRPLLTSVWTIFEQRTFCALTAF